jgi:hypothetical protein
MINDKSIRVNKFHKPINESIISWIFRVQRLNRSNLIILTMLELKLL